MFKMMSFRMNAGPESLPPFTNGRINDCLLYVRPHLNQTLFQLIQILDCGTCSMGWRAILLEHEHIACQMSNCRKHLVR